MKRNFYILCFTTLGILIAILINALAELYYLRLLLQDFTDYSFGLNWTQLIQYHSFFFIVLLSACGIWGYYAGKYWWEQIYVLKRWRKKRWKKFLRIH